MKYTIRDLQTDFPDDTACLVWLAEYLYPNGIHCKRCRQIRPHVPATTRKSMSCAKCGYHMQPTANTIFHKSSTPLTLWFYAIYRMAQTKCGISAAQLQRELGVTYKCAWRMGHQIRKMMASQNKQFRGEVEIDETYVHPNVHKRSSAKRRYGRTGSRTGEILFGMVERGGAVQMWHVRSAGERTLTPIIREHVVRGTLIHTDGARCYDRLPLWGYPHRKTDHGKLEFYREDSYTQNIENVWSHLKRGIKGVYRHVSPKYLQAYADEFAFRYSNRNKPSMFWALLCRVDAVVSLPLSSVRA